MTGVTVRRCCPKAEHSLCPDCRKRLPDRLRAAMREAFDDGDVLALTYAVDESLKWLRAHTPGKFGAGVRGQAL